VYAAATVDDRVIALLRDDGSWTKSVVVLRPANL
jgi:tRNA pseudouridine55 synthase